MKPEDLPDPKCSEPVEEEHHHRHQGDAPLDTLATSVPPLPLVTHGYTITRLPDEPAHLTHSQVYELSQTILPPPIPSKEPIARTFLRIVGAVLGPPKKR